MGIRLVGVGKNKENYWRDFSRGLDYFYVLEIYC